MNILIIGYGKMGKEIEAILLERDHKIIAKISTENADELEGALNKKPDVAIEFTNPDSAFENIKSCMMHSIPCVSGSTGWLDKFDIIEKECGKNETAFFYASNFSLGVNLFFHLNKQLANLMSAYKGYTPKIEETHHIHKKDEPSGTAITTAKGIINNDDRFENWSLNNSEPDKINIIAHRLDEVPGTHSVKYDSETDSIELKHEAKSRKGFALGAVLAAEWLQKKTGVFGMEDMLNLK